MLKKKKHHSSSKRTYAQIINPIHHLERTVYKLDHENDRLQMRVMLLSILSVVLAIAGIVLALFYNN
jgi:nitrate/nitrite-specific signal transduction histidine kinase